MKNTTLQLAQILIFHRPSLNRKIKAPTNTGSKSFNLLQNTEPKNIPNGKHSLWKDDWQFVRWWRRRVRYRQSNTLQLKPPVQWSTAYTLVSIIMHSKYIENLKIPIQFPLSMTKTRSMTWFQHSGWAALNDFTKFPTT